MSDFYFNRKNSVLENKLNITDFKKLKEAENYFFSLGLKDLHQRKYFSVEPDYMHDLHFTLFNEIYDWAGQYRCINLVRTEEALAGLSVNYCTYEKIEKNINEVFLQMKGIKISDLSMDEKINYIIDVVIKIWHIHPFRDCNTRTLVAFLSLFCSTSALSFEINIIRRNADYFRRSLVAASYEDEELGVKANKEHTLRIMNDAFKRNYQKKR